MKMATQMMYSPMPDPSVSYMNMNGYPGGQAPKGNGRSFAFRKRYERIDWRKISSVDLDHISRTLDFNALQENILNITFCNIEAELDLRMIDPNFVKLFKLSQLTIEYLLHSQEYLTGVVGTFDEKIKAAQEEIAKTKEELEKEKKELADVKKESHKRKKLLIAQQHMIHAGSGSYNKCPFCSKAFLNSTFLQSHITRRHSEHSGKAASIATSAEEKHLMSDSPALRELQARLEATEAQLQQERLSKSEAIKKTETSVTQRIISTDGNRTEEHKQELERMKDQFMHEIRELNERLHAAELAKEQFDHKQSGRSFLGDFQEDEVERENIREQREQLAMMKEKLQDRINSMENKMEKKFGKKERNYQRQIQGLTKQHAEDLRKLNDALQKTTNALAASKAPLNRRQQEENEELLRSTRETEKMLRESQETIEDMIAQEQAAMAASAVGGSPTRIQTMEPSDDDDETELGTGTGTGSFGTGRQSMLSTVGTYRSGEITLKTQQFLEELRRNPTLKIMRDELVQLLQDQLDKIGVPPGTPGLPDDVLRAKLQILLARRQSTVKKYGVFSDFRRQYDAAAEEQAREKLRQMKRSPPPAPRSQMPPRPNPGASMPPRSQPQQPGGPAAMFSTSPARTPGSSPQRAPASSYQTPPRPTPSQQVPKPAPRGASPQRTGQSGSSIDWTSTQWESDDDDDETESNQQAFQHVRHVPSSPARQQQPPQRSQGQPVAAPRSQVIMSKPMGKDEDDDWDDSEISELDAKYNTAPVRTQPPQQRFGMSTSPPKGQKVAELSRTIENQLYRRNEDKKIAGAVDVMGPGSPPKSQKQPDILDDFSESDWDVSPVEDESPPKKPQAGSRKPVASVRGSHATDTSNTYGTSVWGSSSKGGSTVPPAGSKERTSFVSVTDVSSDEELMRDIENI